ncbi:MAG: SHD1 domain-containing protein [Verrucomicrobiota bacterium]
MKRNAFVGLLVLALTWNLSTTDARAEAEVRTWTDNTGKFTFEGTFVRSRGSEIMLKKVDGKLLRVPLSRLSREDQDYVTELESGPAEATDPLTGIAWYSSVEPAFAEAKRSDRPIMFMAAATQCSGVPGIF